MKTINVPFGKRSYTITAASGLLSHPESVLDHLDLTGKSVLVSHPELMALFGDDLLAHLKDYGLDIHGITVPSGEGTKNIATLERICSRMVELECDRSSVMFALGGGVIGDLTGFTASVFMRGIPYVQIPTTLLAMTDSSVGGKTGVNLTHGKNLIGTFKQPEAVLIDPELLRTLPPREIISGLGEIIKYGAIRDAGFLQYAVEHLDQIIHLSDGLVIEYVIQQACRIKADIVSADERECGLRRILNFGHTVGHALEAVTSFSRFRHGEAVCWGMAAATEISREMNLMPNDQAVWLNQLIQNLPLPSLEGISAEEVSSAVRKDKKNLRGRLHWVLLERIGQTVIRENIPDDLVLSVIKRLIAHAGGSESFTG